MHSHSHSMPTNNTTIYIAHRRDRERGREVVSQKQAVRVCLFRCLFPNITLYATLFAKVRYVYSFPELSHFIHYIPGILKRVDKAMLILVKNEELEVPNFSPLVIR